jgi:hypothetical protein
MQGGGTWSLADVICAARCLIMLSSLPLTLPPPPVFPCFGLCVRHPVHWPDGLPLHGHFHLLSGTVHSLCDADCSVQRAACSFRQCSHGLEYKFRFDVHSSTVGHAALNCLPPSLRTVHGHAGDLCGGGAPGRPPGEGVLAWVRPYQSTRALEYLSNQDEPVCRYMCVPSTGEMSVYMCDVE